MTSIRAFGAPQRYEFRAKPRIIYNKKGRKTAPSAAPDGAEFARFFATFVPAMIPYTRHTLPNGLTVLVSRDRTSKLAAVNMLYRVGARNEDPARTGFAHLFEHLMFRGTAAVPDFDLPVQMASGESNAFTNNDYTDFYMTLPAPAVETALWLESDRMTGLAITPESLAVEQRVVIEEFRQRYLNQPYGDQSMLLRALAYERHPYRWATIGIEPDRKSVV